jgi:hypothetical protein
MALIHYVITRRDLTIGQASAQIVHAAGESAALYALSSVKERPGLTWEVGGSSPSARTILSSGGVVAGGENQVGVIPTRPANPLPHDTIACVLTVRDESRLMRIARRLDSAQADYVLIREPDMGDQATAIGVIPCERRPLLYLALKDTKLFGAL